MPSEKKPKSYKEEFMIQLSDHFDYKRLLRYTLPSIIMLVFTSVYSVVDGFFVSNFVGKTPFAAVNLIMPVLMILGCIGFMFGTGGSALIAKTLGEGNRERANGIFSLLVYAAAGSGVVLAAAGLPAPARVLPVPAFPLACGLFWEYVTPLYLPCSVSDPWDVLAVWLGGMGMLLCLRRRRSRH